MKSTVKIPRIFQIHYNRNMAKKDSHWFSHDANARRDKKLKALKAIRGKSGICDWWTLVEVLREEKNYRLKFDDKSTWILLSEEFGVTITEAKNFINDCIHNVGDEGLLEVIDGYIYSRSLMERMERWDTKREILRERGRKGAEVTNAKKSAQATSKVGTSDPQAKKEVGTSEEQATQKSGKRNETIYSSTKNTEPPMVEGFLELETLKQASLKDSPFVEQMYRIALYPDILPRWLDAFHRRLEFDGSTLKTLKDYKWHFSNWVVKFYKKMTPEEYSPINEPKEQKVSKLRPAHEIIAEREAKSRAS